MIMHNHAPENYKCPLCRLVNGIEDEFVYSKQSDIFYKDDMVTAFISSHSWPNVEGNVIIIPNEHIENIYSISEDLLSQISILSKKIALVMKKTYNCDGISLRQHNEKAGDQDVWHYHLHVMPRYQGDNLYLSHDKKYPTTPESRKKFVDLLKNNM